MAAVETPLAPSLGFLARFVRSYDPRMWALFLGRLTTSIGHGISFPFLGVYLTSHLGVSAALAGAIVSTAALAGGLAKYAGGTLSDRFGRKRVMLAALAGRSLTTLGLGLLALQAAPHWAPMALLFILGSMAGFLFEPASQAMVADVSESRSRMAGYGLLRVGGNLGWGMGVLAGGFISEAGYSRMFLTTAVVLAAAFAVVHSRVAETAIRSHGPAAAREPRTIRNWLSKLDASGFLLLCAVGVVINAVMAQLILPLSVHAKGTVGLEEDRIGLLYAINGFMIVAFQFPASRWVESRFRLTTTLAIGSLLFGAGYTLVGFAHGFPMLALCVAVFTFGELLVAPASLALSANMAPAERRGLYLGVFGMAGMIGRTVGPLLGGFDLDAFAGAPWIHWTIVGTLGLASAALFLALRQRVDRAADLG